MKFRADEISSLIQGEIENFQSEVTRTEVGRVLEVGDGIARVHGLSGVMTGEMVTFANGVKGLAFNLEETSVGVIILGEYTQIHEGETVTATGELLRVPVGEAMVGRVVNPLGEPIDNRGPIVTSETRAGRVDRAGNRRPPAGRRAAADRDQGHRRHDPDRPGPAPADHRRPEDGQDRHRHRHDPQSEGDRRHLRVRRGRPEGIDDGQIWSRSSGSTARWTTPSSSPAGASDPAPLQYLAPYAGAAMAEYFMYGKGMATLCVYDDLSKQAVAYRELSLLLRRPPGREAYPGDVFYAHSRLLERSAKLANKYVIVPESTPADARDRPRRRASTARSTSACRAWRSRSTS